MRKSANVGKRRCHVARAVLKANLNGAEDGCRSRPTTALHRVPSRRSPSPSSLGVISERRQFSPQEQAAIRFAISLIQGKWKIGILCRLQEGPARLGDLRRLFPQASKKMLTQHLRQMEQDRLIVRTDLSGKVSHVEYSLSEPGGVAVSSLLNFLSAWSAEYLPQNAPFAQPAIRNSDRIFRYSALEGTSCAGSSRMSSSARAQ